MQAGGGGGVVVAVVDAGPKVEGLPSAIAKPDAFFVLAKLPKVPPTLSNLVPAAAGALTGLVDRDGSVGAQTGVLCSRSSLVVESRGVIRVTNVSSPRGFSVG